MDAPKGNQYTTCWPLNGFLTHKMFNLHIWSRNGFQAKMLRITVRKIHIWQTNGTLCFPLRPCIFYLMPGFPPDPIFFTTTSVSTSPCVFHRTPCVPHPVFSHTPGPRTLGPQPDIFHLARLKFLFSGCCMWIKKKNLITWLQTSLLHSLQHSFCKLLKNREFRAIINCLFCFDNVCFVTSMACHEKFKSMRSLLEQVTSTNNKCFKKLIVKSFLSQDEVSLSVGLGLHLCFSLFH